MNNDVILALKGFKVTIVLSPPNVAVHVYGFFTSLLVVKLATF